MTELMVSHGNTTTAAQTISVVVPVFNGGRAFQRCLDSISQSLRQPDEVVVVADGDTDGSCEVAAVSGAKVFRYPSPGGPARARNRGAEIAQGDILFFVDADVTLHPDTIQRVLKTFQADESLTALIGSYDDSPGADNFLSQYKNLFHHYTHQVSSASASTFWGACGAVRRSAFFQVGGFDEAYRKPCIEDIELGYRLKQAGYSIRLCKEIQIKHLKRWEPLSLLRAEIFYRAIPWSKLLLRDRQFNADLNLDYTSRLSVITVFALVVSLGISIFQPWLLSLSSALMLILLVLNISVYRFFYEKRGLLFTLQVIPWHWFYFLYGGASFAYGTIFHHLENLRLLGNPGNSKTVQSRPKSLEK